MTNQYMNNLYRDLLSNSPQTDHHRYSGRHGNRSDFAGCYESREQLFQTGK